jgi:hypothetical protein
MPSSGVTIDWFQGQNSIVTCIYLHKSSSWPWHQYWVSQWFYLWYLTYWILDSYLISIKVTDDNLLYVSGAQHSAVPGQALLVQQDADQAGGGTPRLRAGRAREQRLRGDLLQLQHPQDWTHSTRTGRSLLRLLSALACHLETCQLTLFLILAELLYSGFIVSLPWSCLD